MISTKTRSIKANKKLMEHFDKEAQKKGHTFNSRVTLLMKKDSKFKEENIN